jgi:DNA mismatch repair ATPase MutS
MFQELQEFGNKLRWMKMGSRIVKLGKKQKIIFLYKILEGLSEKSYAINVAQIAGLPQFIIDRANVHLNALRTN